MIIVVVITVIKIQAAIMASSEMKWNSHQIGVDRGILRRFAYHRSSMAADGHSGSWIRPSWRAIMDRDSVINPPEERRRGRRAPAAAPLMKQ